MIKLLLDEKHSPARRQTPGASVCARSTLEFFSASGFFLGCMNCRQPMPISRQFNIRAHSSSNKVVLINRTCASILVVLSFSAPRVQRTLLRWRMGLSVSSSAIAAECKGTIPDTQLEKIGSCNKTKEKVFFSTNLLNIGIKVCGSGPPGASIWLKKHETGGF